MKLNVAKRLVKEDFPKEYHDLVEKLAFPLNQFMEQVALAFNRNITVEDNLQEEIKTVTATVDADGIPTNTLAFKTSVKIRGIIVMDARNVTDATPLTGAPFFQWTVNQGIVTVTRVTGLPADKKFSLTVKIQG